MIGPNDCDKLLNHQQLSSKIHFYILLHRSQIGRCNNRESYKNQLNLQKAMDQARKLVNRSPTPDASRRGSPIPLPETTTLSIMELLKDITQQTEECSDDINNKPPKEGKALMKFSVQSIKVP